MRVKFQGCDIIINIDIETEVGIDSDWTVGITITPLFKIRTI